MTLPLNPVEPSARRRRYRVRPTAMQRRIVELCIEHPSWSARRILLAAGCSETTANAHAREMLEAPGTLLAWREVLGTAKIDTHRFGRKLNRLFDAKIPVALKVIGGKP